LIDYIINLFLLVLEKSFQLKQRFVSLGSFLVKICLTLDIISETGLLGARPTTHPIEQNHQLALATGDFLTDPLRYRRLVGRIIYLGVTRPDISYAIHTLSQFMHAPRIEHWEAAVRVVRYLKGNPGQGILLRADAELTLTAWCDADHATCPLTRRSLTAWFIQLGGSPISWKTRKQDTVSRSSAEAEYRSMADTVSEILWLRQLLITLGVDCSSPIPLFCDNQSAIYLSANPVFHERTKHVGSDCHFIRDEIVRGVIAPQHVSTHLQLADIFTKALGRKEFVTSILQLEGGIGEYRSSYVISIFLSYSLVITSLYLGLNICI